MGRDVNAQLRITLWPATRLPPPATWRFAPELDQTGGVILPTAIYTATPQAEDLKSKIESSVQTLPATLSGETYLRVSELDLENPDEILAFIEEYGPLGGGLAYKDLTTHEWGEVDESWSGALDPAAEQRAKEEAIDAAGLKPPVLRFRSDGTVRATGGKTLSLVDFEPPVVETLNEFRFAAHCIRNLTTAWDVVREPTDEPWTFESVVKPFAPLTRGTTAGTYLQVMLSRFLRRLSPRLDFSVQVPRSGDLRRALSSADPFADALDHLDDGVPAPLAIEPQREPSDQPLYVLCALELFNHILEGATYHVCANERCRRRFVHQAGRSEKGQRRSRGVLYCTPACARATAQREYRKRRRARERGSS